MRLTRAILGVVLLLLSAQPAAAFSSVTSTGVVGSWSVMDNPVVDQEGVRCFYVNGNGGSIPDQVRVRAPTSVMGSHARMTWVGWRFKVLRSSDAGATYQVFFKSAIWKDKASNSQAAAGFSAKSWYPHGNLGDTRLRVQVTILFYKPGSKTKVEGKVVGQYDNYVEKYRNGGGGATGPYCLTLEA